MSAVLDVFPANVVRIAHAQDTGLHHVVIYRDAPLPGPYDPGRAINRYRSWGHNDTGHAELADAQTEAASAREKLGLVGDTDEGEVQVFEVEHCDTDHLAGSIIMGRDGTIVG